MSSETVDEARRKVWEWVRSQQEVDQYPMEKALLTLIAAERADAERVQRDLAVAARQETERMRQAWMVQRERADANAAKCLRYREQIEELENAAGRQRERADGLEREKEHAESHLAAFQEAGREAGKMIAEAATRPYRMAIARWRIARHLTDKAVVTKAINDMLDLLTAADLDAARKENPDVR